jgi:prepilin-type N-terminal cleavage/methylation domain-containing protein
MSAVTHRRRVRGRDQDGFTLPEMLAAIAVLGVLFAAFALVVGRGIMHGKQVEEASTQQTEARAAVDRLAADLRQAYTGDEAAFPIESIGSTQLTFLSPDRQTPFHLRRISYQLVNGELQRAFATSTDTDGPPWSIPALGAWSTEAGSIQNTTVFTYLDESGAATSTPSEVRTVTISVNVATLAEPARQSTYSTSVTLRTTEVPS